MVCTIPSVLFFPTSNLYFRLDRHVGTFYCCTCSNHSNNNNNSNGSVKPGAALPQVTGSATSVLHGVNC